MEASSKIRLAIIGVSGLMSRKLIQMIPSDPQLLQVVAVSRSTPSRLLPSQVQLVNDIHQIDPKSVDVVIDFSTPEYFASLIKWCDTHCVKLVSGTTGFLSEHFKALKAASQKTACLWAPNMSLGINLIAEIIPNLKIISNYDFQIVEAHQHNKKDKPSGTALLLQDKLKSNIKSEIPDPLSLRGGDIRGIHQIWCMGQEEIIKMEHTALDRSVFARGALVAAKWLVQQTPGLYSMKDVLSDTLSLK